MRGAHRNAQARPLRAHRPRDGGCVLESFCRPKMSFDACSLLRMVA